MENKGYFILEVGSPGGNDWDRQNGFTLVELLAVLVILGVIMAITVPMISYVFKGNNKDYYDNLEKTVSSSGQDFFNDYRSNLPRDIGNIKRVGINVLQSQKYVTDINGLDKKRCDGDVVVQKLTNGNYSYTSCLKCEKKNNGSYGYVSSGKECGYSEENNNHYTILIDGLGDKTSIRIPQAVNYTIPNAKVYVNGQALSNELKPMPGVIDVNTLTTYKIYYTFRTLVKELQIKVYDPKKPVVASITAESGGVNYTSGTFTNKDVKVNIQATDWTTSSVYGSGIDHFEYQINDGSVQRLNPVTSDNQVYTASFTLTANKTYNISVKAIDKEGNTSSSKTFVVKIDKTVPTAPVITGGSTTWINTKRTISVSKDATVTSGIKNYQYYIGTSSTGQSGGSWTNLASGVKKIDITTEGTRYIFFRAVGKSGAVGLVSNGEITKIERSGPTAPVITGGSTTWINTKRTISVSRDATAGSGIKNYQYYISTSSTGQNGGSWINLASGVKRIDITTEGTRYIFFRAVSNSGVVGLVSNSQITKIDKTKPVITKVDGVDKWITTRTRVQVSATDNISGVAYYSYDNGLTWKSNNYSTFSASTTLKLAVRDAAGNIVYGNYNVKIDKNPPLIKWSAPDTWSRTTAQVTVTASDAESGVNRIEYQPDNCDKSKPTTLLTGSSFTATSFATCIWAYDNAGNVRSNFAYAKIDKDPPYTPYFSESSIQKTLDNGYISVECSKNEVNSYGNNKCVLKASRKNLIFWTNHIDKGASGIAYKETMNFTNGVAVTDWKRYGIDDVGDGITHSSSCRKEGQCTRRIRLIDNAGNVGPGYLEVDFVYVN